MKLSTRTDCQSNLRGYYPPINSGWVWTFDSDREDGVFRGVKLNLEKSRLSASLVGWLVIFSFIESISLDPSSTGRAVAG